MIAEVYVSLNHWLTGIKVNEAVAERLLKVRENGEKAYIAFRQERLVEKMKKLSAKISRRNLPMFGHQPQKEYSSIDEKQILSGKPKRSPKENENSPRERHGFEDNNQP